jgi:hypothetical protein
MRFQFGGHLEQNPDAHAGATSATDAAGLTSKAHVEAAASVAKATDTAGASPDGVTPAPDKGNAS